MSYERKVKVVLHGYLKKLYPHPIELSGFSAAEILNGLTRQVKELRPQLGKAPHVVQVVGYDTEQLLKGPIKKDQKELHVVPALTGGKGGFFKVVLGVALIAASFYIGPAGLSIAGSLSISAGSVFSFGLSLVLGGLLELLSPAPEIDKQGNAQGGDPEASKYLGANQNTTKIGTRIPIAYGLNRLYGHYVSFDVDAVDVAL